MDVIGDDGGGGICLNYVLHHKLQRAIKQLTGSQQQYDLVNQLFSCKTKDFTLCIAVLSER